MTSFGALITGTFTTPATPTPFNISLPPGYDEFQMVNVTSTSLASTSASTFLMKAYGCSSLPAGYAYKQKKTNGAATNALETTISSGGFTIVPDSGHYPLGASTAVTGVSQAAPALVTTGSTTGLSSNASTVVMYNVTGMQQISGIEFDVGTVVANTSFTLKYLDTTGFAAAGTGGFWRQNFFPNQYFFPRRKFITNISQAASAIVTLSVAHQYVVGEYIRMVVPSAFGMTQMNGQLAQITAVGAADASGFTNTITINVNSSAFTAFAWPASATVSTFAQTVDVAETATILTQAEVNNSFTGVQIGTGVLDSDSASQTYQWFARKGANFGLVTSL